MPVIVPQKEPNLFVSISNFISYKSKKKKKFHNPKTNVEIYFKIIVTQTPPILGN